MKKIKIRTAKSLKKKLEIKPRNEREQWQYYYLRGIYDSRIFGLCIYREKASCDFKNLNICNVVRSLPIGNELHNTIDGRYILRCISFPIANKFNTHPEKVTDVVEQIIENLNVARQ